MKINTQKVQASMKLHNLASWSCSNSIRQQCRTDTFVLVLHLFNTPCQANVSIIQCYLSLLIQSVSQ